MNAIDRLARAMVPRRGAFDDGGNISFQDYLSLFSIDSPLFIGYTGLQANEENPPPTLLGYLAAFSRNSAVFAAFMARAKLFSQARFQFQQMFGGHEGALFGTQALSILEHPEPGMGTGDLLLRAELDAMLAGDWFAVRRQVGGTDRLKRIRPDWTTLVLGSRNTSDPVEVSLDPDAEVIGIGYQPGGPTSNAEIIAYGREEFVHYHPTPNPLLRYRGMPLILAALPEALADTAATQHKRAFFTNGATPMTAMTFPPSMTEEKAKDWVRKFENKHVGPRNAFKALYMMAGMTFTPIGSNFQQMTYHELSGSFETRISGVVGIHPAIIAFSEGLKGSSLNAGNFASAARSSSDITLRNLWMLMCGSMEIIVPPPRPGTRLWYDERSIPFLQADVTDRATVRQMDADAITKLVSIGGFTPDSSRDAVLADDMSLLQHSGLPSVQLQPGPAVPQQALGAFSPGAAYARFGVIERGAEFPAGHPLVLAYPSLFARPVEIVVSRPGPSRLVSGAQIEAARQKLLASGKTAGQASLAVELNVSRDTIRRALAEA